MFGIAAALLAAAALASPALADKKDNSVRFVSQITVPNVDPYFNVTVAGVSIAEAVWDTLIYRDPKTGAFVGDLATSWKWIDERTLLIDLRKGVRFHDGAAFTADDVVYTLNFVAKPENNANRATLVRWIERVEAVTPYQVRIVAKEPFPAAIAYLAMPSAVIHPHSYYAKVGPKGMNEKPIGTGPFRVSEHALGKYLRLERNPNPWNGSPKPRAKIDKVEIRFIPDAQTRVAEVVAGSVDMIMNVNRDQAEQLRDLPALQIVSRETERYSVLRINTLPTTPAPQLKDVRVRRAIMHAIDREAIAKFLVGEQSRVLHVECHPGEFGCSDLDAPRYNYDPAKARQLLAEAGYPNGFDIDLYAWRDRNQIEATIGYLNAVGIKARLRFMEVGAFQSARRAGRIALGDTSWGSNAIYDVSNTVSVFHEFSSDDVNRDPEIRDLLLLGDRSLDEEARKTSYAKALRLIAERAYVLPLYSLPTYYVAAKDLAFTPQADDVVRFYEMSWK